MGLRGLALLGVMLAIGCAGKAEKSVQVNSEFAVDTLFTDSDGYTIKRFHDNGRFHYYVTPGPAKTIGVVQNGKAKFDDMIETK